jgi:hypothetical protein
MVGFYLSCQPDRCFDHSWAWKCCGYPTVITVFTFLADSWLQIQADKHRLRGVRTRQLSSFCSLNCSVCTFINSTVPFSILLCADGILGLNPGMLEYTPRQHIVLNKKYMRTKLGTERKIVTTRQHTSHPLNDCKVTCQPIVQTMIFHY